MDKTRKLTLVLFLFLLPLIVAAAPALHEVQGIRMWTAPDNTRLVFDVSGPVTHKVFPLRDPERLVIDLETSRLGPAVRTDSLRQGLVKRVRHAPRQGHDLRVVLDLTKPVRPKSFLLKPNDQYGHRLVIDLHDLEAGSAPKVAKDLQDLDRQLRDVVVAIDAGHGGEDPGAIGKRGTREKDVTLAIARKLKRLVDARSGMRAELTRSGDYYVGLRKRMEIARSHRADLFVSIHADAFRDRRVRGSSVYVLSRRGASSEAARWLAEQENSADLVGGVSLDDKDEVLAWVLLDLAQSGTQQASEAAAEKVYRELRRVGRVHGTRVQKAGFMVLKAPDIPSMLVETGFISNPSEERNLASPKYQQRIADSLLAGVEAYFKTTPPPGTYLAKANSEDRRHVIRRGDTLSEIASRYAVSLKDLRKVNELRDDRIRIGQVLRIPET